MIDSPAAFDGHLDLGLPSVLRCCCCRYAKAIFLQHYGKLYDRDQMSKHPGSCRCDVNEQWVMSGARIDQVNGKHWHYDRDENAFEHIVIR